MRGIIEKPRAAALLREDCPSRRRIMATLGLALAGVPLPTVLRAWNSESIAPLGSTQRIGIVATVEDTTDGSSGISPMELADQMRALLETDLASPAAGREYPRADILATVLDPRLFFEHFETDFDLILVIKIKVAPTETAISETAGTSISYHWFTGFFDADREVLRGIEVDTPIVTTTLVRGDHSNVIAKILNWQKRHIAQTVALIRLERKRLVAPNEERLAWNGSDLFRNIENINIAAVPTGGTQNRIVFAHTNIPTWTGRYCEANWMSQTAVSSSHDRTFG